VHLAQARRPIGIIAGLALQLDAIGERGNELFQDLALAHQVFFQILARVLNTRYSVRDTPALLPETSSRSLASMW
jgi:hypothetical protein